MLRPSTRTTPCLAPSLLVPPNARNRLYLRFLRQAELAAWQEAVPSTPVVPAKLPVRPRSRSRLPLTPPANHAESWVYKVLALISLVPALWACWDSADFFSRYPQFVEFVRNLVR